ncbi:hypothetical protein DFH09DRAFT_1089136 [Mycena vulgaris]|nr:hypothetical protein DFH09DRAFT_1089136 [Mycena vulgaris]
MDVGKKLSLTVTDPDIHWLKDSCLNSPGLSNPARASLFGAQVASPQAQNLAAGSVYGTLDLGSGELIYSLNPSTKNSSWRPAELQPGSRGRRRSSLASKAASSAIRWPMADGAHYELALWEHKVVENSLIFREEVLLVACEEARGVRGPVEVDGAPAAARTPT